MATPIRITKLTDKQLVSIANDLHEALDVSQYLVVYSGNANNSYHGPINKDDFGDREYSLDRLEIVFCQNSVRVIIARGRYNGHNESIDVNKIRSFRCSANFDEYCVIGNQSIAIDQARAIERAFAKHRLITFDRDNTENDAAALLLSHIEQLRELELAFHAKQLDADDEFRSRRLESDREATENLRIKQRELEKERQELEDFRKQVNDREPQHERRRLRESLTSDLHKYLEEPKKSAFSGRNLVHFLYLASGIIFLGISVVLTLQIDLSSEVGSAGLWITSIKSIASGIGGAGFVWAGLAGLKSSVHAQTAYDQKLQKYAFDMDRASWVVETLLHMNTTESNQVPDKWLESVCQGLFIEGDKVEGEIKSLDALAALLDATARAKIGTGGFEFELDKRAARKLAEQA